MGDEVGSNYHRLQKNTKSFVWFQSRLLLTIRTKINPSIAKLWLQILNACNVKKNKSQISELFIFIFGSSPVLAPSSSWETAQHPPLLWFFQKRRRKRRSLCRWKLKGFFVRSIQGLLFCFCFLNHALAFKNVFLPTIPTMSSFPRNNRKSVTLSKTATLWTKRALHVTNVWISGWIV